MALDPTTANAALRAAALLALERDVVAACLDPTARSGDAVFARAFGDSLAALERAERVGALGGITGHVAESVVEVVLADHGWIPVWHFVGPGRHGVDLVMLGPGAERLLAVEVKGTLRPRQWPRLRSQELAQMNLAWLDKADNPAMQEWGVTGGDVYGAVAVVNFHDLAYKIALTRDFIEWWPVADAAQLNDLAWIDDAKDPR